MSTAVKNQLRVCALSVKYNIMREMVNRVTFLTNTVFMMLNDGAFIIQWMILFRLKGDIGGYTMREVMLLWGIASSSFGLSHILFAGVFSLPEMIIGGRLDPFLVQPKSVLLGVMTSSTRISAIGDLAYGILVMCIFCFSVKRFALFVLFTVTGAVIITAFALIMGSLCFWFVRGDVFGNYMINGMVSFFTYPDGIFQGTARFLLYLVIPVGMAVWTPVHVMMEFEAGAFFSVVGFAAFLAALSVAVFYRGLRRYASGNLMEARV